MAAALATFDGVLALGGGAILAEPTRALLRGHTVVYLSVELSDAVSRVGLGAGRPLLAVNPRATLKYLLDQRRPLYEEVATATVRTDGRRRRGRGRGAGALARRCRPGRPLRRAAS